MLRSMIRMAAALGCVMVPAAALAQGYDPRGNAAAMNRESYNNQATRNDRLGIPPDQDTKASIKAYGDLMDYGRCASKVSKGRVRDALNAQAASATEQSMFRDIVSQGQACRGVFNPVMVLNRGALAEGLYHQGAGKGVGYGPLQPADPGYKAFLAAEASRNAPLDSNDQTVTAAAACLVAQQPQLADQVLAARHGSAEEAQAMDALFATAPGCAGPKRQEHLSRAYLRAFLAGAAYRFQHFRAPAKS